MILADTSSPFLLCGIFDDYAGYLAMIIGIFGKYRVAGRTLIPLSKF